MKAIKIFFYMLLIFILLMSGCNIINTKNALPVQNATKAVPSTGNSISSIASAANFITGKVQINKGMLGKPLKASCMYVYGMKLYYISPINNRISAINKTTAVQYSNRNSATAGSNIIKLQFINETASELLVSNNIIYYTNRNDKDKIYTIDANGQNKKKLVDESAHNMMLMGSYIYYIDNDNKLKVYDTSLGITYLLHSNIGCFDSDGTNIYCRIMNSDGSNTLNSMNIDGTGNKVLKNDIPLKVVVNNGKVFYTNGEDSQTLYYITTDGKINARYNDIQAGYFQYSSGYIYYSNTGDFENLYKIQINGSHNTKIIDDPFGASFIVDKGIVYFTRNIDTEDIVYKTTG